MLRTTHTIKQAAASLALATTIAVLVAPTALATGNASGTYRDGWYGYAVMLTKQQHQTTPLDGRSPDTRDAAAAASIQSLATLDGRSPDTLDAATQAHSPVVTIVRSPGFQWSDFAIGVAAAFGFMLLAAVSLRVLTTRNRQPGPVATA
jgi:hypothetical protein